MRPAGQGYQPPMVSRLERLACLGGLFCLLALVLGLNAAWLDRYPFPPYSQHLGFRLVPHLMHHFQGYISNLKDDLLSASYYAFTVPERVPLPWHEPLEMLRELRPGGRLYLLWGDCHTAYWVCMPHPYSLVGYLAAAFPGHPTLAGLGITFYFMALLASLYGIGSQVDRPVTGLLAATLAAGYPGLFGFSRWMEGYLPAAALASVMVFLLVRSRGLTRLLPCLLFSLVASSAIRSGEGLSEGIGAGLAVSGPFVLTLFYGLRHAPTLKVSRGWMLPGLLLAVGPILFFLDLEWLRAGLAHVQEGLTDFPGGRPAEPVGLLARVWSRYGAYLIVILDDYLKLWPTALLILGLIFLFRPGWRRSRGIAGRTRPLPGQPLETGESPPEARSGQSTTGPDWPREGAGLAAARYPRRLLPLLWFVVPFVGYSLMSRKSAWYALNLNAPLALATALGLASIPWRWARRVAMGAGLSLGLLQLVAFTLVGLEPLPRPLSMLEPTPHPIFPPIRRVSLVHPWEQGLPTLRAQSDQLLAWLQRAAPPQPALRYVVMVSDWRADAYAAQALRFRLEVARPDLAVIDLADPTFVERGYAGFRPERTLVLLRLQGGSIGSFYSPVGRLHFSPRPEVMPPALLQNTVEGLLEKVIGEVPGLPGAYVLNPVLRPGR